MKTEFPKCFLFLYWIQLSW